MLLKAYPLQLIIVVLMTTLSVYAMNRLISPLMSKVEPVAVWRGLMLSVPGPLILSTARHRAVCRFSAHQRLEYAHG